MIDLCSGLGGASEAFVQAGWTVIRIETNPDLQYIPFTVNLDVLLWEEWLPDLLQEADLVWASPPCLEFSNAYGAPGPTAGRVGADYEPDLSILEACRAIIGYLNPTWWVIENVQGAVMWFPPDMGEYRQAIGPFYLWGKFPRIVMPYSFHHRKQDHDTWSSNPMRANIKAKIPFEVSFALLETLVRQWTLDRWGGPDGC